VILWHFAVTSPRLNGAVLLRCLLAATLVLLSFFGLMYNVRFFSDAYFLVLHHFSCMWVFRAGCTVAN